MDPLTAFVASIIGALVYDVKRSRSKLHEFYPKSAGGGLETGGWSPMYGRHVTWYIEPGEAVWIESKYVRPIPGNIFDADKLSAVARGVNNANDKVPFYASYGQVRRITPEMVGESIQYQQYEPGEAFTTGDKDLDLFLSDEEAWSERTDGEEGAREEIQRRLEAAVKGKQGDLGKWSAVVRDGNHRVFGSILGGEERVAIRLYDNDVQDLRENYRNGKLRPEQRDLMEKARRDTGSDPWWISK